MGCPREALIRRSTTSDGRAALHREGTILARARHPGVVELLGVVDDGESVTLEIASVPGTPLAGTPLTTLEVAGVVAVLATTVADLHDIGIAHRSIDVDHVVVGEDGRPVLTGFDNAIIIDGSRRGWVSSGPAVEDAIALGRLALALTRRCKDMTGQLDSTVGNPLKRSRRPQTHTALDVLDRLAAGLTAGHAQRKRGAPTARDFADRLVSDIPGACVPHGPRRGPTLEDAEIAATTANAAWHPGRADEPGPTTTTSLDHPRLRYIGLVIAVVGATMVLFATTNPPRHRTHLTHEAGPIASAAAARAALERPVTPQTQSATPVRRPLRPPLPSLAAPTVPSPSSLQGRVPAPPLSFADGILTVGPNRYAIGQPGDVISLGRWFCATTPTVALLHPATGQLWLFSGWATPTTSVTAISAGAVPGATALLPRRVGRCDELEVERVGARPVLLRPWVPG